MRILIISHTFPYPPNEGIKLPLYNLIKEFSLQSEVYLLSFILKDELKFIDEIKKYCKKIETVEFAPPMSSLKRFINLFEALPFNVKQFYSQIFKNKLVQLIEENTIDIVFFDFLTTALYSKFVQKTNVKFLHYHDAMSMLFYRNSLVERNLIKKSYWYLQYKKLLKFENNFNEMFDKITVVAPKDKYWLVNNSKILEQKIEIIPNGVDIGYFAPFSKERILELKKRYKIHSPSLLFRGIMNFQPNIDACVWFIEKVFPLIKKEIPEIKLYIVGPNPPAKLFKHSGQDIIITGYVDDIRVYIACCDINIAPMISGSGIKNKVLEAMAIGKPSVVSSIVKEGMPELENNFNVLFADTPEEFVRQIKLLLNNKGLYNKISQNSIKTILEKYTWKSASKKFMDLFNEEIQKRKVKRISIIIPAYNEYNTICDVLKKVNEVDYGIEKEIIVVNDGSTDSTADKVKQLINEGYPIKLISHQKNCGKGTAIKTGIKNSTGDVVAIQDADLEYNPEEIKFLLEPILNKKSLVAYGSRFLKPNPVIYKKYYLGNKIISKFISLLFKRKVTDSYTCYKVFHKKALENIVLKSKGFEIEAELTCKFLKKGYDILELPISYSPRTLQQGKKIKFKDAVKGFLTILANKFSLAD